MIKIEAKRKFVPVEIGKNIFQFDLSDDAILKLRDTYDKTLAEVQKIDVTAEISEKQRIERTKKLLKKSFDYLLGSGAFDKIYKEVGSIASATDILTELDKQLPQAIEETLISEKSKKYLGE